MSTTTHTTATTDNDAAEAVMSGSQNTKVRGRRPAGVTRLVRRLEKERRNWSRPGEAEVPTAQAWRAGVAEGIRLAQVAIRKGA